MSEIPAILIVFCPHTAQHPRDVAPIGFVAMIEGHLTYLPFARSRAGRFHALDTPGSELVGIACRKHGALSISRRHLVDQARAAKEPRQRFRWPSTE